MIYWGWPEFDRLFEIPYPSRCRRGNSGGGYISLEGKNMVLELILPGVKREDVEVIVRGDQLEIDWKDRKGNKRFRSYVLPYEPKGKTQASLKRGVLKVEVPIKEECREQKVEVK